MRADLFLVKLPRKYILLLGILLGLGAATMLHAPKVFADCGVTVRGVNQWQGAVVVMDWQHADGSGVTQATNTQVHIWSSGASGAGPYNNEVHLDSNNQEIGSVNSNGSSAGGTFSQVGTAWAGNGGCTSAQDFSHSSAVVLGYGNTSPCASGCGSLNNAYSWALRCGTLEGNEQTFHYDGVGVPSGARPGGYWVNQVGLQGNNGASDLIRLVYVEPAAPQPPPHISPTVTCNDATTQSDNTTKVSGPCYNADCQIDSVTGDLPGGYIRAGGPVTVTATVYNDSPSGLTLPGNDGVAASHVLNIQPYTGPGAVNGGFYNLSPPYTGPIAFPWSGDTSKRVRFNTNVSSSGNIDAYVGYTGSGTLLLPGAVCSYPVSVYQPPLISAAAACQSSIYGSASDPYLPGDPGINVDIYADGPAGSGRYVGRAVTNGTGNYSLSMPAGYQDGVNHTFYAYALDPFGIENGGPATANMVGCESFHLQPGAANGTLNPSAEDPSTFSGTATVTVTYGVNNSTTYNYSSFPGVPASVTYTYTKNGSTFASGSVPSPTGNGRFNNTTYRASPKAILPPILAGDNYCINVSGSPIDGFIQNDGTILKVFNNGPDTQSSCNRIENKPFFKVYGGSVEAGGSFGSSCVGGPGTGYIGGWFNNINPSYGFGASTQLSALALIKITGFASAQTVARRVPTDLTFANSGGASITPSPPGDAYSPNLGGGYGGSWCLPSQAGSTPATSFGGSTLPGATGSYTSGGSVTLNGGSIPKGQNITLYVNGDVYIRRNITYSGASGAGSWASANDIPSFVLVATGNIYIDPIVTELDGLYSAQSTASGKGKVYTCAQGLGAPVALSNLYSTCNKQLTVYGSFVANQVNMMRTIGSLRDEKSGTPSSCSNAGYWNSGSKTCAAEVFYLSPELYLSNPTTAPPSNGALQYDAMTTLPPVL